MTDFRNHAIAYLEGKGVKPKREGAWMRYEAALSGGLHLTLSYDALAPAESGRLEIVAAGVPWDKSARAALFSEMARLNRLFILRDGFGLKLSASGDEIRLSKRLGGEPLEARDFQAEMRRFLANGRRAKDALERFGAGDAAAAAAGAEKRVYL